MKNTFILAALIILVLVAIPAFGQHPAAIGIDAGWTGFSDEVTDANGWRLGFRAGVYLWNWVELEGQVAGSHASASVGSVDLDTTMLTALVNGVFSLRKEKWAPYALVGFGGANVQVSPGISSFSDFGPAWQFGGGARFFVGKNVALRAEVTRLRENTFDAWNGHWNITCGVSWVFGEK